MRGLGLGLGLEIEDTALSGAALVNNILLEDNSSNILLEDNASFLLMES